MGFILDAFLAGMIPNTIPINIEKRSEMMVIVGSMISVKCIKWLTTIVIEIPKITPTMPPRPESTIASIRNWIRIS